jgi:hypothetical protein
VAAGASVAGAAVAGISVAGAAVAGTSVGAAVAGAPQEESNMDDKTSRLAKDHNRDFLFISLSPFTA